MGLRLAERTATWAATGLFIGRHLRWVAFIALPLHLWHGWITFFFWYALVSSGWHPTSTLVMTQDSEIADAWVIKIFVRVLMLQWCYDDVQRKCMVPVALLIHYLISPASLPPWWLQKQGVQGNWQRWFIVQLIHQIARLWLAFVSLFFFQLTGRPDLFPISRKYAWYCWGQHMRDVFITVFYLYSRYAVQKLCNSVPDMKFVILWIW